MAVEFNIYSIPPFISAVFSLVILYFLLRSGIKRNYEKVFALLILGIFLWGLLMFGQKLVVPPDKLDVGVYNVSPDTSFYYYPVALFLGKLLFLAAGLASFAFLYFSFIFPKTSVTPQNLKRLKYGLVFLFLFLAPIILFTDLVHPKLLVYWAGYGIYHTVLSSLFYALACIFLLITVFSLFSSYRKSGGLEKKQIKIILHGGSITLLLVILTGLFPAIILTIFGVRVLPQGIPQGPIMLLPFEFGVFYSVLRYRLFDIQLIVRSGLIDGISVGIASSVFSGVVFIPYFLYNVEMQIIVISAIGVLVFLFLIQNSLKNISTSVVEFVAPSLKWKECKPDEIHLIHYPSGLRLTSLASKGESHLDPDSVSGMLTAVTTFVQDSFHAQDRDTMRSMVVGDVKLMIEHSTNAFITVVFTGFESSELRTDCRKVLSEVEAQYGRVLKGWNGYVASVKGINKLLTKLIPEAEPQL